MAQSRTSTSSRSDERDTRQKQSYIRFTAETNPVLAEQMAVAICKDESLLFGLTHVVKSICKHPKPRQILAEVFKKPGVASKYSNAYRAFASAQLADLFN
jgi:hypothetical protein